MRKVWEYLVEELRTFFSDNGFTKAVLGLSGGIDSAVTAAIAVEALGCDNVLGVAMPSQFSSDDSLRFASALMDSLDIEMQVSLIDEIFDVFTEEFRGLFEGMGLPEFDVTEENLQARIRGVLLMAISNKRGYLVLNTCNKSEDLVGYCTLYGDSCGAIAPIGDLYKTEVYELANWINTQDNLPHIPQEIIDRPPTAELRPGQLDTDELPPYEVLDVILKQLVDERIPLTIVRAHYGRNLADKIYNFVKNSKHKREQSPPAIMIDF